MSIKPNSTACVSAKYHANEVAESMAIAYWRETNPEFHIRQAEEHLEQLVEVFGFRLVKPEPAAVTEQTGEAA